MEGEEGEGDDLDIGGDIEEVAIDDGGGEDGEGGDEEEEDPDEYVHVNEQFYYLDYVIRMLGLTHAFLSFCMLIAYYNLKVPLAVFKREKEVARRLEFDGLYLVEQPEDDDVKAHWDKLVISAKYVSSIYYTHFVGKLKIYPAIFIKSDCFLFSIFNYRSFPALYWDKFVKKRVRQKYGDQFEFEALSNTLGMEKSAIASGDSEQTGIIGV